MGAQFIKLPDGKGLKAPVILEKGQELFSNPYLWIYALTRPVYTETFVIHPDVASQ